MRLLTKFHGFFPEHSDRGYWRELVTSVYSRIASSSANLFPAILCKPNDANTYVEWKTPVHSGDMLDRGYFNTLVQQLSEEETSGLLQRSLEKADNTKKKADNIKKTLLRLRFPLLETPVWIMIELRRVVKNGSKESTILDVTPLSVIEFFEARCQPDRTTASSCVKIQSFKTVKTWFKLLTTARN